LPLQEAFSGLLGDANELTQEMASRGISVVYSLSDAAARKQLLDGLVSTLQGGSRCSPKPLLHVQQVVGSASNAATLRRSFVSVYR